MLSANAANILAWYNRATAADLEAGLQWYERAEQLAEALAAGTDYTPRHTAGVIAALSPRVSWPMNVAGATAMVTHAARGLEQPTVAGFSANRDKAWRILMRDDLDPLDTLGGPKVTSFYRNLTGDHDAVTIDVWAAMAAGEDGHSSFTPKQYERVAEAYREAAKVLDITPRNLQAAVWVTIRRTTLETMPHHYWLIERKDFE